MTKTKTKTFKRTKESLDLQVIEELATVEDLRHFVNTMAHHPCHSDLKDELMLIDSLPPLHDHVKELREEFDDDDMDFFKKMLINELETRLNNGKIDDCDHNVKIKNCIQASLDWCNELLKRID